MLTYRIYTQHAYHVPPDAWVLTNITPGGPMETTDRAAAIAGAEYLAADENTIDVKLVAYKDHVEIERIEGCNNDFTQIVPRPGWTLEEYEEYLATEIENYNMTRGR